MPRGSCSRTKSSKWVTRPCISPPARRRASRRCEGVLSNVLDGGLSGGGHSVERIREVLGLPREKAEFIHAQESGLLDGDEVNLADPGHPPARRRRRPRPPRPQVPQAHPV